MVQPMLTIGQYLVTLFFCIGFEFLTYLALSHFNVIERNIGKLFLSALIINSATNPLTVYLAISVGIDVCMLQYVVILTEGILLRWFLKTRFEGALVTSFAANFVSYVIGSPILVMMFYY